MIASRLGRALGAGSLKLDKRGAGPPRWVLAWKDSCGRRRRQALSTDKRIAERLRAELIHQRDLEVAGLGAVEGQSMLLVELRKSYLADLRVRVGAKQLRSITDSLERVLRELSAQRVRDLRVVDLMRYRVARLQEGVANRTVNVETGALRSMLRWAVMADLIAKNPLANVKPLPTGERHQRHVRRALSDAEIERFLAAASDDDTSCDFMSKRGRVPQSTLWRALIETGARWGELTSTTWADLDAARRSLTLRAPNTKSGRTRMIPLRQGLVVELLGLRDVHQRVRMQLVRPGDRIFLSPDGSNWAPYTTNARRLLRRTLDRAGIDRINSAGHVIDVHALRHTALSRMARRGVPLIVAQRIAGHSSPEITSRHYVHVDLEDLRVGVEESEREKRDTTERSA